MISALWSASTGMKGQQTNIDVISNNLANVNSSGFKKSRVDFEDLMYQTLNQPGSPDTQGSQIPVGIEKGHGTKVSSTQKIFTIGDLQNTDNPLDIVIEGDGFLQVARPDGSIAYTRDGALKQDSQGRIVTSEGYPVLPNISIPQDTTDITITSDGTVNVKLAGREDSQQIGQLELARFSNPGGLNSAGRNLFEETVASGPAMLGTPGSEGFGTIAQGFLEKSNVEVVEEMVNMIGAQRAYEVNSKTIQAADEMLATANQLRR